MLTAAQLRAARGLLDWTRADLAKAAGLSQETIKNIEHGAFRPQESTTDAIVKAFAAHDVEFIENDGVRHKKDLVKTFNGLNGFRLFLDDIYNTVKETGGITYQCNFSDDLFVEYTGDFVQQHIERMAKIPNVKVKSLTVSGDQNFVSSAYCEYRWLSKHYELTVPYYLYGDNIALLTSKNDEDVCFVVVHSPMLSNRYLQHFELLWDQSIVPEKKPSH